MNKIVKTGLVLAVAGLTFQSCQKDYYLDDLTAANTSLKEFQQAHLFAVATIVDLNRQLSEAQAQIDANLVTIDNLNVQVENLTVNVEELETENVRLNQVIVNLNDKINNLEGQIIVFEDEMDDLNDKLTTEQSKNDANQETIDALETQLVNTQNAYNELVANPIVVVEIQTQIVREFVDIQTGISAESQEALQNQLDAISDEYTSLRTDLQNANTVLTTFISFMNTDLANIDALIDELGLDRSNRLDPIISTRNALNVTIPRLQSIKNNVDSILNQLNG